MGCDLSMQYDNKQDKAGILNIFKKSANIGVKFGGYKDNTGLIVSSLNGFL